MEQTRETVYGKLICVTNRKLCRGDFFEQMRKVLSLQPKAVILREKDLAADEYKALAEKIQGMCDEAGIDLFIHSQVETAKELGCRNIHFSLPALRRHAGSLQDFEKISLSCHSIEDVKEGERLGADRIVFGNVYETECKKGLAGKGIEKLQEICRSTSLPVYAIGGIDESRVDEIMKAGAEGGCMMSRYMSI